MAGNMIYYPHCYQRDSRQLNKEKTILKKLLVTACTVMCALAGFAKEYMGMQDISYQEWPFNPNKIQVSYDYNVLPDISNPANEYRLIATAETLDGSKSDSKAMVLANYGGVGASIGIDVVNLSGIANPEMLPNVKVSVKVSEFNKTTGDFVKDITEVASTNIVVETTADHTITMRDTGAAADKIFVSTTCGFVCVSNVVNGTTVTYSQDDYLHIYLDSDFLLDPLGGYLPGEYKIFECDEDSKQIGQSATIHLAKPTTGFAVINKPGDSLDGYIEMYYGEGGDVVIPQTVRGTAVKGVLSNAFAHHVLCGGNPITSITIGENILASTFDEMECQFLSVGTPDNPVELYLPSNWGDNVYPKGWPEEVFNFKDGWFKLGKNAGMGGDLYDIKAVETMPYLPKAKTVNGKYNGSLLDWNNQVYGTVEVITSKPNSKGKMNIKATVKFIGGAKLSYKGTVENWIDEGKPLTVRLEASNKKSATFAPAIELTLGGNAMKGSIDLWYASYTIDGALDVLGGDRAARTAFSKSALVGTFTGALEGRIRTVTADSVVYSSIALPYSATINKSGKAKVTVIMPNGKKVSQSSVVVEKGETWFAVPVLAMSKSGKMVSYTGFRLGFALDETGAVKCEALNIMPFYYNMPTKGEIPAENVIELENAFAGKPVMKSKEIKAKVAELLQKNDPSVKASFRSDSKGIVTGTVKNGKASTKFTGVEVNGTLVGNIIEGNNKDNAMGTSFSLVEQTKNTVAPVSTTPLTFPILIGIP